MQMPNRASYFGVALRKGTKGQGCASLCVDHMDLDSSVCKPNVKDSACLSDFLISAAVTGQPSDVDAIHEYQ